MGKGLKQINKVELSWLRIPSNRINITELKDSIGGGGRMQRQRPCLIVLN